MEYKNKHILCFAKNQYFIFTSYKVLFSSLRYLADSNHLLFYNTNNLPRCDSYKLFGLFRNPFERIESLYKDKVLLNIDKNNLQNCQLEIVKVFSEQQLFNKLISFQSFIESLPSLINKEAHFFPQNSFIPDIVTQYIDIKNVSPIETLIECKLPRINQTPNIKLNWTKKMKDIIYDLYDIDFKRFKNR